MYKINLIKYNRIIGHINISNLSGELILKLWHLGYVIQWPVQVGEL